MNNNRQAHYAIVVSRQQTYEHIFSLQSLVKPYIQMKSKINKRIRPRARWTSATNVLAAFICIYLHSTSNGDRQETAYRASQLRTFTFYFICIASSFSFQRRHCYMNLLTGGCLLLLDKERSEAGDNMTAAARAALKTSSELLWKYTPPPRRQ